MKLIIITLITAVFFNVKAAEQRRALMVLSDYNAIETLGHRIVPTAYDESQIQSIKGFFAVTSTKLDILKNAELNGVDSKFYDLVIIPDSSLVLEDLVHSDDLGRILTDFANNQKTIVTIGHGTSALLSAIKNHGRFLRVMVETKMVKLNYHFPREEMPQLVLEQKALARNWPFANMKMTGYSKIEDINDEGRGRLMFYTEEALDRAGAKFESKWGPARFMVQDRFLISAQNSQSTIDALKLAVH